VTGLEDRRSPSTSAKSRRRGPIATAREAMQWRELLRTQYGVFPIAIFSLIAFFDSFTERIFSVAGPNIAQDLNLDLRTIAGISSVVGILSLASAFLIGWLSDRTRRTRLAGAGIVVAGAAGLGKSAAQGSGSYASLQVGGSVGGIMSRIPFLSLIADYYPIDFRGRAYALLTTLTQAGELTSILVVGVLVTAIGWRTTNVIFSIPLLLLGLLTLVGFREPARGYFEKRARGFDEDTSQREDPPMSFGEGWRTVWSVRTVRRLVFAQMFTSTAAAVSIFTPFVLADRYGLSAAERSFYAFPLVIIAMVFGFMGGGLVDVLGRRSPSSILRVVAAMNGVFSIVGYLILGTLPPLWILITCSVITTAAEALVAPTFVAIFSQVIPANVRGQGLPVVSLGTIPSRIVLGLVFGPIVAAYGFGALFFTAIPFAVIGTLIMVSAADFLEVDKRNAIIATATGEEARRAEAEGKTKRLVCRDVNVFYESNQVLFGVDFEVEAGEIVALLGTNGAGKSTLLRAISGSQEASDGAIVLDGRDITHMPPHEIVRRGVVSMPGGRGIFPGLTVEENLRLATWTSEASEEGALIAEAYELFPVLRERRGQKAGLLSGGEQQMLSLAQAFMSKPKLLMIDELTLGLAPAVVAELIRMVQEINRRGTTVIVVEQSVNVALTIAERAVFMEKGEVRFVGKTSDLLRRPDILRAVYVRGASARPSGRPPVATDERVVLEASGIVKRFGGVNALNGVDLTLRDGQTLGLIGPNGSGKTTLFDIISGYQAPDEGTIAFDGTDVTELSASERAKRGLVRRFQDARLFPSLTVMESLLVALDQRLETKHLAGATVRSPGVRRDERRARQRAEQLIDLLDLGAYRDKFVKELSTGLRRIVDIAWVLATEPKVLLLDEPSSGVAQAEAEQLAPLLRRVGTETGCAVLLVEHDIPLVSAVSDELIAMANGEILLRGPAADVLDDERVIEAFLGTSEAAVRRSGALR
jgi:ABC-type branched-subunit amino acid transport system ATPase component/MFS family permease